MVIRHATEADKPAILAVHREAFGAIKGPEIAQLVDDLLDDPTAAPTVSLVATDDAVIVGHILHTKVTVVGASDGLSARILAPLAVRPEWQGKGIGKQLILESLIELQRSGVMLVFVLGHPGYYPHSGFTPAGQYGFQAPYPIPDEHADAWMVQALSPGIIGYQRGKVHCAETLHRPEHWRE